MKTLISLILFSFLMAVWLPERLESQDIKATISIDVGQKIVEIEQEIIIKNNESGFFLLKLEPGKYEKPHWSISLFKRKKPIFWLVEKVHIKMRRQNVARLDPFIDFENNSLLCWLKREGNFLFLNTNEFYTSQHKCIGTKRTDNIDPHYQEVFLATVKSKDMPIDLRKVKFAKLRIGMISVEN